MKRKIILSVFVLSVLGLTLSGVKKLFFPEWTFNSPEAYNTFYSVYFSSMVLVVLSTIAFFKEKWLLGLILISGILCGVIVFGQFNPIDTYTFPKDVEILKVEKEQKLVLVEHMNCKTNHIYHDTILVKDKWIFRKHIK